MKNNRLNQRVLWALGALLIFPRASLAAPNCTVIMLRELNFGNYKPFRNRADNSSARVRIRCTGSGSVSYQLMLSTGLSGSYFPRQMTNSDGSGARLNYNIYTSSARTTVLGDGTGGTQTISFSKSARFTKRHTLYGQIPALQTTVKVGSYSDVITVTVNY